MVIKKHRRCNGTVEGQTLRLFGKNLGSAADPEGDVQWYIAGKGAKAAGFATQQWLAKVDGIWYIRRTGRDVLGPTVQRGQCRVRADEWSTQVDEATPDQISTLEMAEVREDKLPYIN